MGTLYIVSTPIGNLQDITIRGVKTLFLVDYILCENVGKTKVLVSQLRERYPTLLEANKNPRMQHFNEYIENENVYSFVNLLEKGHDVALVSEAGTPLISDPGYKLVRHALKKNIPVISIPGPSAVTSALVVSGLPTNSFLFLGFLPKTVIKKERVINNLKKTLSNMHENNFFPTIIFFESPHRIPETLDVLYKIFGDIHVVITRELTKKFEEVLQDYLSNIMSNYQKVKPKGEFTILFNTKIMEKYT